MTSTGKQIVCGTLLPIDLLGLFKGSKMPSFMDLIQWIDKEVEADIPDSSV